MPITLFAFIFQLLFSVADTTVYMCSCTNAKLEGQSVQYTYLVRGSSPRACRDADALKSYPGYKEFRVANEGKTWTLEERAAIKARKAQRAALRLEDLNIVAVNAKEFPEMIEGYYSTFQVE